MRRLLTLVSSLALLVALALSARPALAVGPAVIKVYDQSNGGALVNRDANGDYNLVHGHQYKVVLYGGFWYSYMSLNTRGFFDWTNVTWGKTQTGSGGCGFTNTTGSLGPKVVCDSTAFEGGNAYQQVWIQGTLNSCSSFNNFVAGLAQDYGTPVVQSANWYGGPC